MKKYATVKPNKGWRGKLTEGREYEILKTEAVTPEEIYHTVIDDEGQDRMYKASRFTEPTLSKTKTEL